MSQRFAGKSILVTGAASGIGRATARAFAAEGGRVMVADRNYPGAQAVAAEIGGESIACAVDVNDPESCQNMITDIVKAFGRLDVAVNNAGIPGSMTKKIHEYDLAEWDGMIRTNLSGVFYAIRAEVPALLAAGGGAIVNTASVAGLTGGPTMASYVSAKHGVVGLTKAAGLDLIGDNIRVNAVCPGVIRTGMTQAAMGLPAVRQLLENNPAGRVAEPEEVARVILFLASDEASFMVGSCVAVDGGVIAQ